MENRATRPEFHYKHIVVVHGIGDQARNETALGFINEFIRALPRGTESHPDVDVHNLLAPADSSREESRSTPDRPRLFHPAYFIFTNATNSGSPGTHVIGFSEVYWRHIPDRYLDKDTGQPPIPIFTWARSINTRLLKRQRTRRSYHQARQVIDYLEKLLKLLRLFALIYKKSARFGEVLTRFLGDVQVYAESDQVQREINNRFLSVLARVGTFARRTQQKLQKEKVLPESPDFAFHTFQIYIVAHSEGTVVAYSSLVEAARLLEEDKDLYALFDEKEKEMEELRSEEAKVAWWFPKIAGLVTLGSPLDKHFAIWDNRFHKDHLCSNREKKIPWFNYWDHSDPVGYGLKELFDPTKGRKAACTGPTDAQKLFDLDMKKGKGYDRGFTRYFVPLLAHVQYWKDNGIQEHIIDKVMDLGTTRTDTAVGDRWWAPLHRWADRIAYLVVRLTTLAVLLFYLNELLHPVVWALQSYDIYPVTYQPLDSERIGWIVGLLAVASVLRKLYTAIDGCPKFIDDFRKIILLVVAVAASYFCLQSAAENATLVPISDWLGYLLGFVVSCLIWRLHTLVHRALVDMWRYTKGSETQSPV